MSIDFMQRNEKTSNADEVKDVYITFLFLSIVITLVYSFLMIIRSNEPFDKPFLSVNRMELPSGTPSWASPIKKAANDFKPSLFPAIMNSPYDSDTDNSEFSTKHNVVSPEATISGISSVISSSFSIILYTYWGPVSFQL